MKGKVLILALAAAFSVGGVTCNTHAAATRSLPRHSGVGERVKEKLGLTDEQITKIKSELTAQKDEITDVIRRLHDARKELHDAVQSNAAEKNIREAAAKLGAVEADAAVLRAKLHKNISPILTDEQTAKLKEMRGKVGDLLDHIIDKIGERLSK